MKEVKKEIKSYKTVFVAVDDTEFYSQEECQKYEQSARGVLLSKYKPLVIRSENECNLFSCGSDDNTIDIIKITTPHEAEIIEQIFYYFNSYVLKDDNESYVKYRTDTLNKIKSALESDGILFIGRGCDMDSFWIIDSKENIINNLNNLSSINEQIYD